MLSGHMELRKRCGPFESICDRDGGHYSIYAVASDGLTRELEIGWFYDNWPTGEADKDNLFFFSTSGVHGTYTSLEEVEFALRNPEIYAQWYGEEWDGRPPAVTFSVYQPRTITVWYGNVRVNTLDDIAYLKKLRASTASVIADMANPNPYSVRELERLKNDGKADA